MYLSFSFFLLLLAKGSKSIWQLWVPIHFSPSINSWGSKNDPESLAGIPHSQSWDYRCTKFMQCWGSNSGLWACQAPYLSSSERVSLLQVGLRWSEWSTYLQLPPSSWALRTAAAPSSCILQIETLSTLSEKIVGSQRNRQTSQVASCLSETWLCSVLYTVFLKDSEPFMLGKPTLLEWMLCKLEPRESRKKLELIETEAAYICEA